MGNSGAPSPPGVGQRRGLGPSMSKGKLSAAPGVLRGARLHGSAYSTAGRGHRLAQGGHVTTAGRGQPSPVPGPAWTPGLHLELCDVVNFLCQILCPACQTDYCGARRQQGRARRRKDRHAAYLCPSWGATTVVAGLAKEPQARSPKSAEIAVFLGSPSAL